jgi:hypothetical protein
MIRGRRIAMRVFTAVLEKCPDTGLYVGFVPVFPAPFLREKHWKISTRICKR